MAPKNILKGVFAPVPTPLNSAGALDSTALSLHLHWLEGEGLDGVLLLGSNGEFPTLTLEEREAVAVAAEEAGTRLQRILNVGSCSILEVERLIDVAVERSYDAVLCPPPFYFRSAPPAGIVAFIRWVLDHSPLPVLLYHIPQVTGIGFSDALLDLIGDHPRLAGIKDSSGEMSELTRLTARFAGRVYFVGNDRLVAACREAGGAGSISAVASIDPRLVAAASQDSNRQPALTAVRALMEEFGLIPAAKAVLADRAIGEYRTRPPLMPLDEVRSDRLLERYRQLAATE